VASGDQPVKRTRKRGEIDLAIRVEWFVLYQVVGLTPEQILNHHTHKLSESGSTSQVMKAVREMSALIGLPLRPTPRGRPKKQR
jgi:hypothetical protein